MVKPRSTSNTPTPRPLYSEAITLLFTCGRAFRVSVGVGIVMRVMEGVPFPFFGLCFSKRENSRFSFGLLGTALNILGIALPPDI